MLLRRLWKADSQQMKILMVSAEAIPFAKTGGLADAVTALSKALVEAGQEVKILIPRYYFIDRKNLALERKSVLLNIGFSDIVVNFYSAVYKNVQIYFVDYEKLFGRSGIYGENAQCAYADNPLRFNVLARAAFLLCKELNWIPDIMHANDWSSGMVPVLLKYFEKENFGGTKSVLTIHNLAYQGTFSDRAFPLLGLPPEFKSKAWFDQFSSINFLKAAIFCADKITTVSPTYAKEISGPQFGCGLDGLIRLRSKDFEGIINGADLSEWNPETDRYIPFHYSKENLENKAKNKAELQKRFGLKIDPEIPVVGIVCRLAEQKGIKELFAPNYGAMYRMCRDFNVQFVVAGTGESWCEQEIKNLSKVLPNLARFDGYSEEVSHLIEAGSDYFLMPSKYEPCGLNQIYSMIYGTLPIAHDTGGLSDTVTQFDETSESGTGFKFTDLTPDAIYGTVKWALSFFTDKKLIKKLRVQAMNQDFSWKKSAEEYINKIYMN